MIITILKIIGVIVLFSIAYISVWRAVNHTIIIFKKYGGVVKKWLKKQI